MSLPPLPEPIFRYYNWQTESSLPSYSADQMREYGQQCYEQGKADAAMGTQIVRTHRLNPGRQGGGETPPPSFAPFDAEDDLK